MKAKALKTGLAPGTVEMYHKGQEYEVVRMNRTIGNEWSETETKLCIIIDKNNPDYTYWVDGKDFEIYGSFFGKKENTDPQQTDSYIKAVNCMAQHIKTFKQQCERSEMADFGKPCEECPHASECDLDWTKIMYPITKQSSIGVLTKD